MVIRRGATLCGRGITAGVRLLRARWFILLAGVVFIVFWQADIKRQPPSSNSRYRNWAATGLDPTVKDFLYFYYYLGLYPAHAAHVPLIYDSEGAKEIFENYGRNVEMEHGWVPRFGDPGKVLLYWPWALVRGSPENPQVRPFHGAVFLSALIALYASFCLCRQPVLGLVLALLFGSNPFQLYEVYHRENLFGWTISLALLMLAMNLPFLRRVPVPGWYLAGAPLLSGVLLATVRQFRSEPVAIICSVALAYLVATHLHRRIRAALLVLLAVTFIVTSWGWQRYFRAKMAHTAVEVERVGGDVYRGPRAPYHPVWHPLFCGLADFDTKYGHVWDDNVAYAYAAPILEQRFGIRVERVRNYCWQTVDPVWRMEGDAARCNTLELLPQYPLILKERILSTIREDPRWYLTILVKRVKRLLFDLTPIQIQMGERVVSFPAGPWILAAGIAAVLLGKSWYGLWLIVFFLPLSFPALFIYSDRGNTYSSCYHLVAFAVFVTSFGTAARKLWRHRFGVFPILRS